MRPNIVPKWDPKWAQIKSKKGPQMDPIGPTDPAPRQGPGLWVLWPKSDDMDIGASLAHNLDSFQSTT